MTPATPEEDDRTVIRPQAPRPPAEVATTEAPAPAGTSAQAAPADDDRTVIRPRGAASAPTMPPLPAGAVLGDSFNDAFADPLAGIGQPGNAAAPATGAHAMPTGFPASAPVAQGGGEHGNALPVGTRLGEFELTSIVGEGGFGIVYLAHDHSLGRRVALKEYMPAALAARGAGFTVQVRNERHRETFSAGMRSFVNEARLLAQFDHPAMVKVYRFWEQNGTAYMVMPFYEGDTLKDRLAALAGPPDEGWLMGLLDPLTSALAVLHDEHCYHRDIAPDNIILLRGDRPLLLDFGAARRVIGDMTQALTVILKSGYAPVEQYAEVPGMKQGPWTDVYALAASVYYAIERRTPPASVGRMVRDSYVPLVQSAAGRYSERFLAAIDAALAVHPDQRITDMRALRVALGLGAAPSEPTQMAGMTGFAQSGSSPGYGATAFAGGSGSGATGSGATGVGAVASGATGSGARTAAGGMTGANAAAQPRGATGTATAVDGSAAKSRLPLLIGGGVVAAALIGGGLYFALAPSKAPAPVVAAAAPAAESAAPAAVAPTVAPAPAVSPADVVHEAFARVLANATPGFDVDARSATPTLAIGRERDLLAFSVRGARKGTVYAWIARPDGSLIQLIPGATRGSVNRERALPANEVNAWPLDWYDLGAHEYRARLPVGHDRVLVLVSASPRKISGLDWGEDYGHLAAPAGGHDLDRLVAMLTAEPACAAGKPCDAAYGAALFDIDEVQ